jgi:peptide/nickel transport system substrate-binding protein
MDSLKNGATTPWLATAWAWSNSDKTLTFTIRNGVKWSDGVAFSAKDVVYSFNLLKKNPRST